MGKHAPLPEELGEGPFTVGAARAAGVGEGRLRGSDLRRPFHGVRGPGAAPAHPALDLIPRLREGDRFSSVTALALLGAPLPGRLERTVHVTAGTGLERPRLRGVLGHDDDGQPPAWFGVPISEPGRAFLEAARVLHPDALVAAGDFLIHVPRFPEPGRPFASLDELRSAAARKRAGARAARNALELVRPGVESPQETRLRLLLLRAGLPEPICGFPLDDGRGHRIGWFDLAWPEHRVLGEYDGDEHRTSRAQYERDIWRFDAAADLDWRVVRVRSWGLGAGARDTVRRFARALGAL